ncbi:hypothetical protein JHK85_012456 [Glycine max]|nr:hypothetical protein JHK85_012456 [Glycine max]KAG5057130.1 hypothetical protein JHK86_012126 [Glycine max]
MDSLIEHFGDVKELRSGKVLYSALGSDKEVAQLFNTIGTDLPNPDQTSSADSSCKTKLNQDRIKTHIHN